MVDGEMVYWWNKYQDWLFCFSQILNMFICFISEHNIFAVDKAIHNFHYVVTNNNYSKQVYVIKLSDHWNTGLLQVSANICEGDRNSDLIHLL